MLNESRLYELIGEKIRHRREQFPRGKMTQGELAAAIGMERTSISNIEKGMQKVSIGTLSQIAAVLHVTLTDLLPLELVGSVSVPTLPRPADPRAALEQFPIAARATEALLRRA